MAAISWDDVYEVASELGKAPNGPVPAGAVLMILAVVNGDGLDANNFGGEGDNKTFAARVFLAAHMATMILRKGVGGMISHQSEGGASQGYLLHIRNPSVLDSTSYGQMLRALAGGTPARAGFLAGGGPAGGWG